MHPPVNYLLYVTILFQACSQFPRGKTNHQDPRKKIIHHHAYQDADEDDPEEVHWPLQDRTNFVVKGTHRDRKRAKVIERPIEFIDLEESEPEEVCCFHLHLVLLFFPCKLV